MTRFQRVARYVSLILLEVAAAMRSGDYYKQEPWEGHPAAVGGGATSEPALGGWED